MSAIKCPNPNEFECSLEITVVWHNDVNQILEMVKTSLCLFVSNLLIKRNEIGLHGMPHKRRIQAYKPKSKENRNIYWCKHTVEQIQQANRDDFEHSILVQLIDGRITSGAVELIKYKRDDKRNTDKRHTQKKYPRSLHEIRTHQLCVYWTVRFKRPYE